jgi:glycolate oxidase
MAFAEVSHDILGQFEVIVGQSNIIVDAEERYPYSHDETEDHSFLPDVVLKPGSAEEISKIMKLCNEHGIAVTPRGGGTGLSGGALPLQKGVVISMERIQQDS